MDKVQIILDAAKATGIPAGSSGLWRVQKTHPTEGGYSKNSHGVEVYVPPGTYTHLFRLTTETMLNDPPGEVVMVDTPDELKRHLQFMLVATGRVLVTGLGLGCLVRGLLTKPDVTHITCVERDPHIINLVLDHMPADRRLQVHFGDAHEYVARNQDQYDYAWHDIWSDRENDEPWLDIQHTQLIYNTARFCSNQGAWAYNRVAKAVMRRKIKHVNLVG